MEITEENFPDAGFREYVQRFCDDDGDGTLSDREIAQTNELWVNGVGEMYSLRGIEYFTALTWLRCYDNNQLTSLDVSGCKQLRELDCHNNNQLTTLDLSNNTALMKLYCYDNDRLTSLDVSGYKPVEEWDYPVLYCYNNNQLTTLDLSNNTTLMGLYCYDNNRLTSLDVSGCKQLEELDCRGNSITELDLSKNLWIDLERFYCDSSVSVIYPIENMAEINAENFPNDTFRVYVLSECDTDHNGVLSRVEAKRKEIGLGSIQARSMKGIEHFFNLRDLSLSGQFTELDLSHNTELTRLSWSSSNMTSLDVSHNTALTWLVCYDNQLTELDLSHNTALMWLMCNNNQLTALDLSHNTALLELECQDNQLTSLDVSKNTALRSLTCGNNQLAELDITNNTALESLYCRDNNIIYLDARNCFRLSSIVCDPEVLIDNGTTPPKIFTSSTITNARTGEPYSFQFVARGTPPLYLSVSGDVPEGLTFSGTGLLSGTTSASGSHTFTFTASNDFGTASETYTLKVRGPVHDVAVINAENFPDEQFRGYVSSNFDTDRNGILDSDEIADAVMLNLDFYGSHITSLKGIEYFTALTWLDAHGQELTELDLSNNTALTFLRCRSNPLKALDLSHNTELAYLNCRECPPLASLDLSRNTKLETLYCSGNSLTELDLSANTRLIAVECSSNDLVWLNIDNCGELTALDCRNNAIPRLNTSGCPKLTDLLHDGSTEIVSYHVDRPAVAPAITTTSITSPATGQAYTFTLKATGSVPITWTHTGKLPAGLTLSEGGLISGTPTKAGKYTFTVKAANSSGSDTGTFTLEVFDPVSIQTASLKDATIGKSYSVTLKGKGTKTITWSAEGLPSGLSINEKGKISGKPTVHGTFSVKVTGTNGAGSTEKTLQLKVKGIAPKLSGSLAKPELGKSYSSGLKLTAGSEPVTWSITGTLPDGLAFDSTTGIISGTPTSYVKSGYKLTITATNDTGSKSKKVTLTVKATKPTIKTTKLHDATVGTPYTATLSATGSAPITWRAENLPAGLTLDADSGLLSGTISASEKKSVKFTVYAENPVKSVKKSLTLKVNAAAKEIPPEKASTYDYGNIGLTHDGAENQLPAENDSARNEGSYIIVAELGTVSVDEAGMYDFTVTLSDDAHEGAELVYLANSDTPSDDDDIAEFWDVDGAPITAVPSDKSITISIWLNPERVYTPVIAVKH